MAYTRRRSHLIGVLLVAVPSLLALTLVLLATAKYGAGLSADSASYLSTAASVSAGRGFVRFDGAPLVDFPPFFSIVLAAFGSFGGRSYAATRYVNAVCSGLIVFAAGMWLLRRTSSLPFALLGAAAVLVGKPILLVSSFLWSEPLFILCTLGFLFSIEHFLLYRGLRALLISAAFAALAFLTRYIGVVTVATGLLLLLVNPRLSLRDRAASAALFASVSLVTDVAWIARNYLVSATPTGTRAPASFGALLNVYFTLDTLTQWVLPAALPSRIRIVLGGVIVVAAAAGALWSMRRRGRWMEAGWEHIITPACFAAVYTFALLILASRTAFDRIDDRLLSPIYAPMVMIVVATAAHFDSRAGGMSASRWRRPVGIGLAALWLALSAGSLAAAVRAARANGAGGYATTAWQKSEIVRYVRGAPDLAGAYSNNPEAMYLLAGLPATSSPRKYLYNSPGSRTDDLARLERALASAHGRHLVWFENVARPFLYSLPELSSAIDLEPVVTMQGGAVYRMRPKQR